MEEHSTKAVLYKLVDKNKPAIYMTEIQFRTLSVKEKQAYKIYKTTDHHLDVSRLTHYGQRVYPKDPAKYNWSLWGTNPLSTAENINQQFLSWFGSGIEAKTVKRNAFLKESLPFLKSINFFALSAEQQYRWLLNIRYNDQFMSAIKKDWKMSVIFMLKIINHDPQKMRYLMKTRYGMIFKLNALRKQYIPKAYRRVMHMSQQQAMIQNIITKKAKENSEFACKFNF